MCTEEQIEKVMNMEEMKCPCCGKRTVSEYDICDGCNWENDPVQLVLTKCRCKRRLRHLKTGKK